MTYRALFAALAFGIIAAGCSDGDDPAAPSAGSPGAVVQVPAVEGPVVMDQFCSTYDRIACLANTSCCSSGDHFASVDECLKSSPCPADVRAAFASPLVASGALVYDASAAGDFLRSVASSVSSCGKPLKDGVIKAGVLKGTRGEGEDCAPSSEDDSASPLSCGAGLRCARVSEEQAEAVKHACVKAPAAAPKAARAAGEACEDGADCQGGRCAGGVCASRLAVGEACEAVDDCESGQCQGGKCAAAGEGYCSAAAPEAPANTDWTYPDTLCLRATNAKNAGTSGDIYLYWISSGRRSKCTITGGIDQGEEKCCTAAYYAYNGSSGSYMSASIDSEDGLRIDYLKVKKGSDSWSVSTVRDFDPDLECEGCAVGYDCESCWIDSDGHGDCHAVAYDFGSNNHPATCGVW